MKPIRRRIRRYQRKRVQTALDRTPTRFEIVDSRFENLIPASTKVDRLAGGFRFTEGPIWLKDELALLFSDIPADTIYRWSETDGVNVYRKPSGNSNGLTLDIAGRLIACEHGNRRVSRTQIDGSVESLCDGFNSLPMNSPNDVVARSDGSIYFTDPPYGIDPSRQEQPVQGVYRIDPNSSQVELVLDDFVKPNGLAFSPDESVLYIDDSDDTRCHIRAFDTDTDGSLRNGRVLCSMDPTAEGVPDGMKVDVAGNIFCTGPGGLWLFDSTGKHLGTVILPEIPANCAWGGDGFTTLYVTARTGLYQIPTSTKGTGVFID